MSYQSSVERQAMWHVDRMERPYGRELEYNFLLQILEFCRSSRNKSYVVKVIGCCGSNNLLLQEEDRFNGTDLFLHLIDQGTHEERIVRVDVTGRVTMDGVFRGKENSTTIQDAEAIDLYDDSAQPRQIGKVWFGWRFGNARKQFWQQVLMIGVAADESIIHPLQSKGDMAVVSRALGRAMGMIVRQIREIHGLTSAPGSAGCCIATC